MAAAAPTGCYKCGRPGHWSRDCPSAPASAGADQADANPKASASRFAPYPNARPRPAAGAATADGDGNGNGTAQKKKKERTKRPKLTPDMLLSDDGIGFVLRYFPKAFKPRGRAGHEVDDLGDLIKLYTDWHSRLIPYYSFEQFVRKVEKVGASNRVRRCISELRNRVARGGDPTKLHELPTEEVIQTDEPDETVPEDPILGTEAPSSDIHVTDSVPEYTHPPVENYSMDPMQEDLLNEIYEKAADEPQIPTGEGTTKETPQPSAPKEVSLCDDPLNKVHKPQEGGSASTSTSQAKIMLTEEQRARMEANRLKALERAAARARASQPT